MSPAHLTGQQWQRVASFSDTFTCYSAAIASWTAADLENWPAVINPGLHLTVTNHPEGIFGFAYFPATLRRDLGLVRTGADDSDEARDGVLAEIARTGRAIVAGDSFRLPWHVAYERRHAPHWYVLQEAPGGLEVVDAFAARNDLGIQEAARQPVSEADLPRLLLALPGGDPVFRLREALAFGDDTEPLPGYLHQWFVQGTMDDARKPAGADGPAALRHLAAHFRDRGQELDAYRQADDIWSIARHRSFLCRVTEETVRTRPDDGLAHWLDAHGRPLVKRWNHVAPLLMQATLALASGRTASTSVAETLEELAEREAAAAAAFTVGRALAHT